MHFALLNKTFKDVHLSEEYPDADEKQFPLVRPNDVSYLTDLMGERKSRISAPKSAVVPLSGGRAFPVNKLMCVSCPNESHPVGGRIVGFDCILFLERRYT